MCLSTGITLSLVDFCTLEAALTNPPVVDDDVSDGLHVVLLHDRNQIPQLRLGAVGGVQVVQVTGQVALGADRIAGRRHPDGGEASGCQLRNLGRQLLVVSGGVAVPVEALRTRQSGRSKGRGLSGWKKRRGRGRGGVGWLVGAGGVGLGLPAGRGGSFLKGVKRFFGGCFRVGLGGSGGMGRVEPATGTGELFFRVSGFGEVFQGFGVFWRRWGFWGVRGCQGCWRLGL